jgi:methyl-accepting chemotaxis protein
MQDTEWIQQTFRPFDSDPRNADASCKNRCLQKASIQFEHLASGIKHLMSGIEHSASGIEHSASGIEHLASGIEYLMSGIEHLASITGNLREVRQ